MMYFCVQQAGWLQHKNKHVFIHTDDFHAYIPISFMRNLSHAAFIWLSTLASKTEHNQYHTDQNASKTKTILP